MRARCLSAVVGQAVISTVIASLPATAHHSPTAVYDLGRTVSVQGVVTEFRFVNPHAMMFVDVTGETGHVVKWTVEFAGRLNLSEGGWTERTIVKGQRVAVTGNPTHVDSPRLLFTRLVRPDGTELLSVVGNRLNDVERARRERARERDRQK